jgi:hypothetical protein
VKRFAEGFLAASFPKAHPAAGASSMAILETAQVD